MAMRAAAAAPDHFFLRLGLVDSELTAVAIDAALPFRREFRLGIGERHPRNRGHFTGRA